MPLLRSCLSLPLPSPLPSSLPQITAYYHLSLYDFFAFAFVFQSCVWGRRGGHIFYKHATPPELSSIAIEFQSLLERVVFIYHTIDVPNGAFLRLCLLLSPLTLFAFAFAFAFAFVLTANYLLPLNAKLCL